jgi:thioredoxin-like negative regulator of GroEL
MHSFLEVCPDRRGGTTAELLLAQETQISGGLAVQDDVRPLLVFFYSPRSGPARRMESLLAHLARKERDRLRLKRVDVDAHPELAERFKVAEIPAVVLVKGKRVVDRIDGRASAPSIERMLAPHLSDDLSAVA